MKSLKKVDWGKAPEGATHYNEDCSCPWLKETPASYFAEDKKVWVKYISNELAMDDLRNAVKHPQEWGGDGLPPVGTVCEYYCSEYGKWRKCEVVAHYFASVVAVDVLDITASRLPNGLFRPIKTPEQIAAEEKLQAIDEMMAVGNWHSRAFKEVVDALYDAGYRKTEEQKYDLH